MTNQTDGWNKYYRHGRLAHMPELFVVRFFRGLRNSGGFLSEHKVDSWTAPQSPSILDFGCGNGRHMTFLAQEGWQVTGCDVSGDALALAADALRGAAAPPRLDVIANDLPYEPGSFDVVLAHGVFDHIPASERVGWQEEVGRVLKPGGLLFASFITNSLHASASAAGEEILQDGEEAGLTQTFYSPESIVCEYGRLFDVRSIAYDHRGLLYPADELIEHRLWAFLERKADAASAWPHDLAWAS
jgi:SAM-dependent methyltransferase